MYKREGGSASRLGAVWGVVVLRDWVLLQVVLGGVVVVRSDWVLLPLLLGGGSAKRLGASAASTWGGVVVLSDWVLFGGW